MSGFMWGALGALAPEIVRWFRIAKCGRVTEWRRPDYWLATVAYMALGGLVAVLVAKPDAYAAFLAGIGVEFAVLGTVKAGAHAQPVREACDTPSSEEMSFIDVRHPLARLRVSLREHAAYLRP